MRRHAVSPPMAVVTALRCSAIRPWHAARCTRFSQSGCAVGCIRSTPCRRSCWRWAARDTGFERWISARPVQLAVLAICAIDLLAANPGRYWHASTRKASPEASRTVFDGDRDSVERLRAFSSQVFLLWRSDTVHGAMPWAMSAPALGILRPMATTAGAGAAHQAAWLPRQGTGGSSSEPSTWFPPCSTGSPSRDLIARQRLSAEETKGSAWTWRPTSRGSRSSGTAAPHRASVWQARLDKSACVVRSPKSAVAVDTAQPAFLETSELTSQAAEPGSTARKQPVYRTNIAFRGVRVPAGQHRIAMRFEPSLLAWCCMFSLLASAVWLTSGLGGRVAPPAPDRSIKGLKQNWQGIALGSVEFAAVGRKAAGMVSMDVRSDAARTGHEAEALERRLERLVVGQAQAVEQIVSIYSNVSGGDEQH